MGEPRVVARDPEFVSLFGNDMAQLMASYQHHDHNHGHNHDHGHDHTHHQHAHTASSTTVVAPTVGHKDHA